MKCYYHGLRDAVATCGDCNKHLCKTCYDDGYNGLCQRCMKRRQLQKVSYEKHRHERNHRLYLRRSHYALLIGLLLGIGVCIFISQSPSFWEAFGDPPAELGLSKNQLDGMYVAFGVVLSLMFSYSIFSFYAGCSLIYRVIDKILSLGFILFVAWPVLIAVLFFASFIGVYIAIPMYFYHLIQHVKGKKKFAHAKEEILG